MNGKELLQDRKISSFFYENMLLEFVQKKLPPQEHALMKSLSLDNIENKEALGSVLLALEYLDEIQKVEVQSEKDLLPNKWRRRAKRYFSVVVFTLLTVLFFVSGYIAIEVFQIL